MIYAYENIDSWTGISDNPLEGVEDVFFADDKSPEVSYERTYVEGVSSSQACSMYTLMYTTAEGTDYQELNEQYWATKHGQSMEIMTGFRYYFTPTSPTATFSDDAEPMTYSFYDWAINTDTAPVIDNDKENTDSGAAALLATAATALAAIIMF